MTTSTVAQYLAALPADRRAALSAVRKVINQNLPDGYEEGIQFGRAMARISQKSGMVLHFLCFCSVIVEDATPS
jgi:hypothetical protein